MTETIETLTEKMQAAAQALDFEEAKRCRDRINLMRGGASAESAEQADLSGLTRQKAGAMGLGTSQQGQSRPEGWKPPAKPDPMTKGRNRRGKRRP
ncbi:UvrB/UvrC motif-containing protein [Altericroceibacterium endophyticum]|uniref:Excinuclease ABC subunit B n=1 Tax=Altericroceibacterium endophyticum TaxID=1808508 RepID=A0A6I4SZY2_9SPHN|nr:UvrB/UvrC motif-containing protein [Altericroceibacterium endophyticum]MXO64384.1 excinuclease ABC subunit B [Altericroceibacterium endophyticum]